MQQRDVSWRQHLRLHIAIGTSGAWRQDPERCSAAFADLLLGYLADGRVAPIARSAAAAYLASFLGARGVCAGRRAHRQPGAPGALVPGLLRRAGAP